MLEAVKTVNEMFELAQKALDCLGHKIQQRVKAVIPDLEYRVKDTTIYFSVGTPKLGEENKACISFSHFLLSWIMSKLEDFPYFSIEDENEIWLTEKEAKKIEKLLEWE